MNLLGKLGLDDLNQVVHGLLFSKQKQSRNNIAHFCEHNGIYITFTRASTSWHALAPCALKPWWLLLKPLKNKMSTQQKNNH